MDRGTPYDEDIYAWSQQQADALRRLAARCQVLPNELDLEHVAEEIEDLGKSQRDAAESYIRLILIHLIKCAADPESPSVGHWRGEIVGFHIELLSKLTPAMANRIDLDRLWSLAKREARARLTEHDAPSRSGSIWADVGRCPLDLAALSRDEFDVEAALERLRSAQDRPRGA